MNKIFLLLLAACAWTPCSSTPKRNKSVYCSTRLLGNYCIEVRKTGSDISLKCPLKGVSYAFFDGKKRRISSGKHRYIVSGNTLTIKQTVVKDSGRYICEVRNSKGSVTEWRWALMVKPPGKDISQTKNSISYTELPAGSSMVYDCRGKKRAIYYLLYSDAENGAKSKVTHTYRLKTYKGIYQLSNLERADSGFYYCGQETSRGFNIRKKLGKLVVRDLPRIGRGDIRSKNKVVDEGALVRFVCRYRGPQDIAWYKNGKKITNGLSKGGNYKKWVKLTLKNVKVTDAGDYKCCVTINKKTVYQTASLQVKAFNFHPNISVMGSMKPGSGAVINCQTNNINATYSVLHKNLNANVSRRIKIDNLHYMSFKAFPELVFINNLRKKDEGEYICEATNGKKVIRKKVGEIRFATVKAITG